MKNIYLALILMVINFAWSQEQETTIYLIRHAEKASGSPDPELSDAGKERAGKLAAYFKDKSVDAVYSTPYKRTQQTVQPLASFINQEAIVYNPMEMDINMILAQHKGGTVVIVGHSNTIPGYVNKFIKENKYLDMDESTYNNLYIINITGDKVVHALEKL